MAPLQSQAPARLSEISKQLRELQSENYEKSNEIDRLNRKMKILTDLKGVSVADTQSALEKACEGQAFAELKSQVVTLKRQLAEVEELQQQEQPEQQQNEQEEEQQKEQTERVAGLELRVAELEEIEDNLREELNHLEAQLHESNVDARVAEANKRAHQLKVANDKLTASNAKLTPAIFKLRSAMDFFKKQNAALKGQNLMFAAKIMELNGKAKEKAELTSTKDENTTKVPQQSPTSKLRATENGAEDQVKKIQLESKPQATEDGIEEQVETEQPKSSPGENENETKQLAQNTQPIIRTVPASITISEDETEGTASFVGSPIVSKSSTDDAPPDADTLTRESPNKISRTSSMLVDETVVCETPALLNLTKEAMAAIKAKDLVEGEKKLQQVYKELTIDSKSPLKGKPTKNMFSWRSGKDQDYKSRQVLALTKQAYKLIHANKTKEAKTKVKQALQKIAE